MIFKTNIYLYKKTLDYRIYSFLSFNNSFFLSFSSTPFKCLEFSFILEILSRIQIRFKEVAVV